MMKIRPRNPEQLVYALVYSKDNRKQIKRVFINVAKAQKLCDRLNDWFDHHPEWTIGNERFDVSKVVLRK